MRDKFIKYGERLVLKKTNDSVFTKKWVSRVYDFWFTIFMIIGTILIIIVVRNRAYRMIDNIGFQKTIITFIVIITIIQIKNSRFLKGK